MAGEVPGTGRLASVTTQRLDALAEHFEALPFEQDAAACIRAVIAARKLPSSWQRTFAEGGSVGFQICAEQLAAILGDTP